MKTIKMGRPTKYKHEYCQRLIEFFDVEPYQDIKLDHYEKSGKKDEEGKRVVVWTDIKRMANKLPTLRDFAKSIDVSIRTVYDWINKEHSSYKEEFSHTFTCAREIRKWFLIQNALQGLYPPASYMFTAKNITDMTDKQEIQLPDNDALMKLTPEEIQELKQLSIELRRKQIKTA